MRKNKFGKNKVAKIRRTLCFAMAVVCAACSLGACGSEDDRHIYPDSTPSSTANVDVPPEPIPKGDPITVEYHSIFEDGFAYVTYEESGSDMQGMINTDGVLVYSNSGVYLHSIGKNAIAETRNNMLSRIIDASGNVVKEFDEDLTYMCHGGGYVMVSKSSVSEVLIGIIDYNGNWVYELSSLGYPLSVDVYENKHAYVGDDVFYVRVDAGSKNDDHIFINLKTNSKFLIKNRYLRSSKSIGVIEENPIHFVNGVSFAYNVDKYSETGSASIVNLATGKEKALPEYFLLHTDGTFEEYEIPENVTASYSNGYMIFIDKEDRKNMSFQNISNPGSKMINYTAPAAINTANGFDDEGYCSILLNGIDGGYVTAIDENGVQLFEPFKVVDFWAANGFGNGTIVYKNSVGKLCVYSIKDNKTTETDYIVRGTDEKTTIGAFNDGRAFVDISRRSGIDSCFLIDKDNNRIDIAKAK